MHAIRETILQQTGVAPDASGEQRSRLRAPDMYCHGDYRISAYSAPFRTSSNDNLSFARSFFSISSSSLAGGGWDQLQAFTHILAFAEAYQLVEQKPSVNPPSFLETHSISSIVCVVSLRRGGVCQLTRTTGMLHRQVSPKIQQRCVPIHIGLDRCGEVENVRVRTKQLFELKSLSHFSAYRQFARGPPTD